MENNNKTWFDELTENLRSAYARTREVDDRPGSVVASVYFNDGCFIDIELYRNNDMDVFVYHADNSDRPCPNIVKHIEDNIPDWYVLEEEYEDALIEL